MKKSVLLTLTGAVLSTCLIAQNNLVPNGSFEETEKKVKKGAGEIQLATGWIAVNEESPADLFAGTVKKEYSHPENIKGYCLPADGDNFAGVRFYSDRGGGPRTYIMAKLKKPLIAGKSYCVSFKVSLSDLSKAASANITAYVGGKAKMKDIEAGEIKPNVQHSKNRIFKDSYLWETVCSTITAEGGERYMTIGNFKTEEMIGKKETERMRLTAQFRGTMQTRDSYYFVDDVQIVNMEEIASCDCEEGETGNEMEVVYTENVGETEDMDVSAQIELKKVSFDENSDTPKEGAVIKEVAEMMNNDASVSLILKGFTSKKEEFNTTDNLSLKRAESVKSQLVELGVDEARISTKGLKDSKKIDESGTKAGNAKNRRVEFEVE